MAGEHVRFISGHQNHVRRGPKSPQWKGGRNPKGNGYIRVQAPGHPGAVKGYVYEHRIVAERELGRLLAPGEVVHHLNGVRDDNRPENLIVIASHVQHQRLHAMLRDFGIQI